MQQGEIWWASLPHPHRRRPVLILTRSQAINELANITIAPLTRTIRSISSEVALSRRHGVPTACAISFDNILTIPKDVLRGSITKLNSEMMERVFAAIRFALAIPDAS